MGLNKCGLTFIGLYFKIKMCIQSERLLSHCHMKPHTLTHTPSDETNFAKADFSTYSFSQQKQAAGATHSLDACRYVCCRQGEEEGLSGSASALGWFVHSRPCAGGEIKPLCSWKKRACRIVPQQPPALRKQNNLITPSNVKELALTVFTQVWKVNDLKTLVLLFSSNKCTVSMFYL